MPLRGPCGASPATSVAASGPACTDRAPRPVRTSASASSRVRRRAARLKLDLRSRSGSEPRRRDPLPGTDRGCGPRRVGLGADRSGLPRMTMSRIWAPPVAANCPQAPSISRPRVSRTVTATPFARRCSTKDASAPGVEAVQMLPGVGLSGITLTCARRPRSSRRDDPARQSWSLMSLDEGVLDAHPPAVRFGVPRTRPGPLRRPSLLIGTRVLRNSSSGRAATAPASPADPRERVCRICGTRPTVETVIPGAHAETLRAVQRSSAGRLR